MSDQNDELVLGQFFYEIPFRDRRTGKTRVVRGISYSGALQIMHAWNARHPQNVICLGQAEEDDQVLAFLRKADPDAEYLALRVPAWYAQFPQGRVYGRCAERLGTFRDPAAGFVAVEHKAIRNAILMLVPPRIQVEAVAAYERLLQGSDIPELPEQVLTPRETLLREIKRRLLQRGAALGELDARAEALAQQYEAEGGGSLDEFLARALA